MWWQTARVIPMIAMIVYDHIITIPEEVKMLWSRRKSLATIVIIVNRYALLAYGAFLIAILLPITENPLLDPRCKTLYFFGNVCTWILLIAGIVFDCLRIYGITQGTGRIIASFTVGLLGIICITPVFLAITSVSAQGQIGTMASFGGGSRSGCQDRFPADYYSMHGLNRWLYIRSTFSIAFEASVLGIILFKTLGVKRAAAAVGLRTSLIDLLVRDGAFQFGFILLLSILDISLIATSKTLVTNVIYLKSIITTHIAFRLRHIHQDTTDTLRSLESVSLHFNSNITGNTEAPLHSLLSDSSDGSETEATN